MFKIFRNHFVFVVLVASHSTAPTLFVTELEINNRLFTLRRRFVDVSKVASALQFGVYFFSFVHGEHCFFFKMDAISFCSTQFVFYGGFCVSIEVNIRQFLLTVAAIFCHCHAVCVWNLYDACVCVFRICYCRWEYLIHCVNHFHWLKTKPKWNKRAINRHRQCET